MPGSESQHREGTDFLVVGANHRSASAFLRDRLFADKETLVRRLEELKAAHLGEAVLLTTCDRVDIYTRTAHPDATAEELRQRLARWAGVDVAELRRESYQLYGEDARRHLFAVAASLDSQVIGEPNVLGQLKEAHRVADSVRMVSAPLHALMKASFAAARRVRQETPIAERPVTLAASAIAVARDVQGDVKRASALLLGLGEMGELLAGEFQNVGLGSLQITHRFATRAEEAAQRLRCHLVPWEERQRALETADIVISAVGQSRFSLDLTLMKQVMKARRRRALFVIDTAVPGDVEAEVQNLDGIFVYNLEDLEAVAQEGLASREGVAVAAWRVLGQELDAFRRGQAAEAAVPTLVALRQHMEKLRGEVLAEKGHDAQAATRLLMNRILHDPTRALKEVAGEDEETHQRLEEALSRLFGIERGPRLGPGDKGSK